MSRLTVVDEMFLRTHRAHGTPILLQGLWSTERPIAPETVDRLHRGLAAGSIARRVVPSPVPGARRRWVQDSRALPIDVHLNPLAPEEVVPWADQRGQAGFDGLGGLDPQYGPGWAVSIAPCAGGGSAMSVVCSHSSADAQSLMRAVDAALRSDVAAVPPDVAPEPHGSDLADAAHMFLSVGGRTLRAVESLVRRPARRREIIEFLRTNNRARRDAEHASRAARDFRWTTRSVILGFDADCWDSAAARDGGTSNALFLAVVADAVRRLSCRDDIVVSVPVDLRRRNAAVEARSGGNNLAMSEVSIGTDDSLADIRRSAKSAYTHPMGAPAGFPDEMLQLVTDRMAQRLAPAPGQRDALCSNIGPLPESVLSVTCGGRVRVAARAIHPGLTPPMAAAMRTTVSAYFSRVGSEYTLAVVETDPFRATTPTAGEALTAAAQRYGLAASVWG